MWKQKVDSQINAETNNWGPNNDNSDKKNKYVSN